MKWESIKLRLQNLHDEVKFDDLVETLEKGSQPRCVTQLSIIFKIFIKYGN